MNTEIKIRLSDDDLAMLSAFVSSPVFAAFKRLMDQHREQCQGMLMSVDEHSQMLRLQGRIQGINTLETLPALIVAQKSLKEKKAAESKNAENEILKKKREDYESYARDMEKKRQENINSLR